ncbi:MAG: DUF4258 domain-containing protein [Thermosynechococcaceae cyanobacterium]
MFEATLKDIQAKILQQHYVMTIHADEEMADDELMLADIEQTILTGKILECQKDRVTAERKYKIQGCSIDGDRVEVIAKLGMSGKVVIITVYAL